MSEKTEKVIAGQGPLIEPARVLPAPKYDYQTPRSGSFAITYDDQKGQTERPIEKIACLQNLKAHFGF
jgi:hypothetical protein